MKPRMFVAFALVGVHVLWDSQVDCLGTPGYCVDGLFGCGPIPGVDFWLNGLVRPVLKHGPRSLTCVQVLGC